MHCNGLSVVPLFVIYWIVLRIDKLRLSLISRILPRARSSNTEGYAKPSYVEDKS